MPYEVITLSETLAAALAAYQAEVDDARDRALALADRLLNRAIRDGDTCDCGHAEQCVNPVVGVWLLPMDDGSYEGATWLLCAECGERCTGTPPVPPVALSSASPDTERTEP